MGPFKRREKERSARRGDGPPMTPGSMSFADMRPGGAYELRHWHDAHCRMPQGEACTCEAGGPELELVPMFDPLEN